MKIDLCVTLKGWNLDLLTPLFFETLFRNTSTEDLIIHVVIDDVETPQSVKDYLYRLRDSVDIPFNIYVLEPFLEKLAKQDRFTAVYDITETGHWMMDNCGTQDWVIISHYDVAFRPNMDMVKRIKRCMQQKAQPVGVIGLHSYGIIAINRRAYQESPFRFDALPGMGAYRVESGLYRLVHQKDPRCEEDIIHPLDGMELFTIAIQQRGWEFVPMTDVELGCQHLIRGSGWGDGPESLRQIQRETIKEIMRAYNIQPL